MCGSDILLGFLAILFPPLAVWVKRGLCSVDSLINIALCMLGFLPGLLHAWYIIAVTPDPTYEPMGDEEQGGTVSYYVVQGQPQYAPGGQPQQGYGTVSSAPSNQFPGHESGFVQHPSTAPVAGGSSTRQGEEVPPSYSQAVAGDHKVQVP
ncbi:hypothetical protein LTR95_002595 [Oleoguttula sp. CCFEE 5521]